jgi:hypothetical protein
MGNVLSEEESENEFLEEGFNLDSPEADKVINYGTSAPVWQNSKAIQQEEEQQQQQQQGQEVVIDRRKHSRQNSAVSSSEDEDPKRQHMNGNNNPKKMSYVQMAKLGYQELVNAIIRPPRADYKVRVHSCSLFLRVYFILTVLEWNGMDVLDGSIGSTGFQFLCETIHAHGLYVAYQTWIQSRMQPLGTGRTCHRSDSRRHLHARKFIRPTRSHTAVIVFAVARIGRLCV